MSYLPMQDYETAAKEVRAEFDDQIQKHGRITNMKKTLLADVPSFKAYMEWYTLYDGLKTFLDDRAIELFSYAVSNGNHCLICSTFFRKILIDSGDDPDDPKLTDKEKLLMDLGKAICIDAHNIPPEIYDGLKKEFSDKQIVQLIAFAGIMYATNLFNTVARVPLDGVLYDYVGDNFKGE
ncbi:MAG: hypothetical protein K6C36_02925 [Clostridia bacterium]|nr:hypothetical protein [Clostridia bacterium]